MAEFAHLHLHTHYSLLDGMIKHDQLMDRCKELGMGAVAITDHGNMHGILKFYKTAKKAGVKPIIGSEVYMADGARQDRTQSQPSPYHLVLLAENETGYRNLVKLVSKARLEGVYYKPRIDREILEEYNEGVIVLSACLQGQVARAIRENSPKTARDTVDYFKNVFKDRYYLEVQVNGVKEQDPVNEAVFELAKEFDLPVVATNDCHYLLKEHASTHEVLLCVQTGKTLLDPDRMRFSTQEFYVKSPEEMAAAFPDHPEAITNTLEVAERCNVEFDFDNFIYPNYELEEGQTADSTFEKMTRDGLEKRWPTILRDSGPDADEAALRKQYAERLETEIDLIRDKGFPSYFLIVQDFMNWSRENDIPVGPGRGSAAGSLVSYALKITDVNPLPYGLLFERFMNPERTDNPDIDCDFCAVGREKVIEYVTEKYGKENVAQIATYGTLKAKAAIRDVGRAVGRSYGEVDRIAKMIPDELGITLTEAVNKDPDLKHEIEHTPWVKELIDHALVVEGLSRHASTHAAGVVIGDKALTEYLPVMLGSQGETVTEWDKKDVESVGLIKFDFLGLKTLTVIDTALKIIEAVHGVKIDPEKIPMDDKKTFELFSAGKTTGVFQFESRGMKELMTRLEPSRIDELFALNALYRPGPMAMIDDFIDGKKGRRKITYAVPELENYLGETYGMMVYQEQVMQVANAVAGFSLGDADLMRKAISKKKLDVMATQKVKFIEGAEKKKVNKADAIRIWDQIEQFAQYGFNKSHSAAYSIVAYQTAYLKAHYPVEFIAALLTMDADNTDKLLTTLNEARDMEIKVLPPDVNESLAQFTVVGQQIRFGLSGVKNVGQGAIESIVEARQEEGPYAGLFEFCQRVDPSKVNRRVVESLIKSGAFDSTHNNRAALFESLDAAMERAARFLKDKLSGQMGLFGGGGDIQPDASEDIAENIAEWAAREKLDFEKDVLGFYLTGHPLEQYTSQLARYSDHDSADLKELPHSQRVKVRVGAVITQRRFRDYTKGRMAILTVEDLKGSYEAVVFSEACEQCLDVIRSEEPVLISGSAELDPDRGVRMMIDKVIWLKDADRLMRTKAHFEVDAQRIRPKQIEKLKKLIEAHPGTCLPTLLVLVEGKYEVRCKLSERFGFDPNEEMVKSVEDLFGRNVITFR
jgi:DNA polymerase III subunit alpha